MQGIQWFEHTTVWLYYAIVVCDFALFKVSARDAFGLMIVAIVLALLFLATGILWLRRIRARGSAIIIFSGLVLLSCAPILWLASAESLIPAIVTAGIGGLILIGMIIFSGLLSVTTNSVRWRAGLSLSALVYAGGILLQSIWFRALVDDGFRFFSSSKTTTQLQSHWDRLWYGTIISLVGATSGLVFFYLARMEYEKTKLNEHLSNKEYVPSAPQASVPEV